MPNMPAQVGDGISVWTATAETSEDGKEMARSVLSPLGLEVFVEGEKYIDMATAVSGSGPAFALLMIESLIDAGVHIGLSRDMAEQLVLQTVLGTASMALKLERHPAELRNLVTSPGGTTAEGLLQLEQGGLRALFTEAVVAAYDKAKDLGGSA
jgi:pyrroline-5-carboxylate reductase